MRNALLLCISLILFAAVTVLAQDGIGFYATFEETTPVVSSYESRPTEFYVAPYPRRFPPITPELQFTPVLTESSTEDGTLTFVTRYSGTEELIPVTVDAQDYNAWRREMLREKRYNKSLVQGITEAQLGKKRAGLSIGVDLPKRFDKIFGEGGGNLRVSGYRRISFKGSSQWQDGVTSSLYRQSRFPSLTMEQISRFEITGTIGTKISVKVAQDNQTDIPLANRIQLRYKGDDDDILKVVEAGNTTLNLPNTRFVGYSQAIRGLFGLKAEAQLGNLTLTTIASQEKGSSERATISGGGEESFTRTRDYLFDDGRIYDLGYSSTDTIDGIGFQPNDKILKISVYEFVPHGTLGYDSANFAAFYVNTFDTTRYFDQAERGIKVKELPSTTYQIEEDPSKNQHIIHFNSSRIQALGVYMIIERRNAANQVIGVDTVGRVSSQGDYVLKYLRAVDNKFTRSHPTWNLLWRNVYNIPRASLATDLNLKVFKGTAGNEGTENSLEYQTIPGSNANQGYFLNILGLDQYNNGSGEQRPDGILDNRREVFRPDWGLLIFPHRTPFDTDTTYLDPSGNPTTPLNPANRIRSMYTEQRESRTNVTSSQYYIQYSARTRSNNIRLNRTNIIEGSERVLLNGRQLSKGTDYNIQYDFGQVTLLTDEATDPNSDLKIEFEYAPFFSLAKKTLLGARAEYEWSRDLSFGSTVLYKSDKAQERKPRVGEETAKGLVMDFDANYRLYPGFLTSAINALPLVTTEAQSTLQISGEIAQSRPNPNVDGQAFIDDFESAVEEISLGNRQYDWQLAALPVELEGLGYTRSKMLWHISGDVDFNTIYDGERPAGQGIVRPFRIIHRPDSILVDSSGTGNLVGADTWAGITRSFGGLDKDRVQLFEMRVKGKKGIIHFDFGEVSEDINDNNLADTEDLDLNNSVDENEDIGLDGLADPQEPGYNPSTNPDPNGDNYHNGDEGKCPLPGGCNFSLLPDDHPLNFEWLNGTEGNRNALEVQGQPDQERLGRSEGFATADNYFSFVVDLASDSFLVPGSEKPTPDGDSWRTYRLPIREEQFLAGTEGTPEWDRVSHVRVWFESTDLLRTNDTVTIAAWYFVQSNWQDSLVPDSANVGLPEDQQSKFVVASVSEEDNAAFQPPPGAEAYYDKTNNVTEAQRALSLSYSNFLPGDTGIATKRLAAVERYSGYRKLEMFVHGPDSLGTDSVLYFFRLGRDSVNFYEYQTTLYSGWDERNYVNIDFNEITALKDSAIRAIQDTASGSRPLNPAVNVTSGKYRVFGRPSINDVIYFATGIVNNSSQPIDGEVWLDELRLNEVRKDVGTAFRIDFNGNAADLFNYNYSFENRDPYFRGLSSSTRGGSQDNLGSGSDNVSSNWGIRFNFDKFLPKSWGARVPISYNYSETELTPLLRTNSDIVLAPETRQLERSYSNTRTFSVTEAFSRKGRNPLFSVLLNRQTLSFSYSRGFNSSVTNPYRFTENYGVRGTYNMGIRNLPKIPLFFWAKNIPILKRLSTARLGYYPEQWDWSGDFNRSMSIQDDVDFKRQTTLRRDFNGRMGLTYSLFENLTSTFNMTTRRDLSNLNEVNLKLNDLRLGLETNFTQSFSTSYNPNVFKFFTTNFTYGSTYADIWDQTSETRKGDLSRNWGVGGQFNHVLLLGKPWKPEAPRTVPRQQVDTIKFYNPEDSTKLDSVKLETRPAKTSTPSRPFYDYPLAALRFLTGWIRPVTYKYSATYNNSVPGLLERPGLGFRFGVEREPGVATGRDLRSPTSGQGNTVEFGSGFRMFGGLTTDVKFRRGTTADLFKSAGDRTKTVSTSFPDLSIRISRFTSFPIGLKYINKFIDIFAPATGYSKQVRESFNITPAKPYLLSKQTTYNWNPLLSVQFKLFRALSLSGSYAKTKTTTENRNRYDGGFESFTLTRRNSLGFSTNYAFSAPGGINLPLFGKVKFSSQMNIKLDVRFSSENTSTRTLTLGDRLTTDKSDFSVAPTISYTFSQQIQGGITGQWQDIRDRQFNRNSHVRSLQIWTEIRF